MTTSKLFDRITACSQAMRYVRGHDDCKASYDDVMKCLPSEQMTKHVKTNLTKACMELIRAAIVERDSRDRKVKIVLCVAISIADDSFGDGLTKEICDRFRGLEDFDRQTMTEIFNLSVLNDRVLVLLDNAMILNKKNIRRDIQHEFLVEFVLIFFSIVESALRRGKHVGELGYATSARPSDMQTARAILEKHVSSIATMCGPCFILHAVKKPRPRSNLFPANGACPQATIVREHVDYDKATVTTLKHCLLETKEKDEFLDIIFAIISHSHKQPTETFAGMKLETTKTFFLETVLNKTDADDVLKTISKTSQEQRLCEEVASLKKALAKSKRKMARTKALHTDQLAEAKKKKVRTNARHKTELAGAKSETKRITALVDSKNSEIKSLLRRRDDLAFRLERAESDMALKKKFLEDQIVDATAEAARLTALCADRKKQLYAAIREKRRFSQKRDEAKVENMRLQEVCDAQKRQLVESGTEKRRLNDEEKDRGDDVSDKSPRATRQKICPFPLEMVVGGFM